MSKELFLAFSKQLAFSIQRKQNYHNPGRLKLLKKKFRRASSGDTLTQKAGWVAIPTEKGANHKGDHVIGYINEC